MPTGGIRERVQVLEPRAGVREVMLVTSAGPSAADDEHAVIVLSGGGGGFAVTCPDGVPRVQGGLPLSQRERLAMSIGGPVMALSPPSDQPVMDREWRMSDRHVIDLQAAVDWVKTQWPRAKAWVLGVNNGALSAAVATANIEDLAGAILLACSDEAFDQPQKSDRMRMLAVRYRRDASLTSATVARTWGRKTLVTVHDERAQHAESTYSEAANRPRFSGKDFQVVDVVARWILTGMAPDEIR
ncbi:MAG TPA: hypothetical protein VJX31_02955 [Casimicrobiaceae bacterium]|nr:hypothetical protein [Casimicrobiaceae bacterium]